MNRHSKRARFLMRSLVGNNPALSMDFSQLANGPVPGLIGSNWRIENGKAVCYPTLLGELFSNPDFSGTYVAGLAPSWSKWYTTFTPTEETTLVHSGTQAQRITAVDSHQCGIRQNDGLVRHKYVLDTIWVYFSDAHSYQLYGDGFVDKTRNILSVPAQTYTKMTVAGRVDSGTIGELNHLCNDTTVNQFAIFDDASCQEEVIASLMGLKRMPTRFGSVSTLWTKGAFTSAPMGSCMNVSANGKYGVFAYYDDGKIKVDTLINDVWAIATPAVTTTYGADKSVKLERIPGTNTYRTWYGVLGAEVQIGPDFTVTDAGIINNQYGGMFDSSNGLNTCSKLVYGLTPGEIIYNGNWVNGLYEVADSWGYIQRAAADRITLVTDVTRRFAKSARFEVRSGDSPTGYGENAQLSSLLGPANTPMYENESSGTKYYGISIQLDASWYDTKVNNWAVVFELHGPDDYHTNPMLLLQPYNPDTNTQEWIIGHRGGDLDSVLSVTSYPLSESALNKGAMTDFILKIKFDKVHGSIDIWRRDAGETPFVNVLSIPDTPTLQYKTSEGGAVGDHYWKIGFYRGADTTTQILWHDGLTVGTSYEVVADTFK